MFAPRTPSLLLVFAAIFGAGLCLLGYAMLAGAIP